MAKLHNYPGDWEGFTFPWRFSGTGQNLILSSVLKEARNLLFLLPAHAISQEYTCLSSAGVRLLAEQDSLSAY